VAIDLTYHLGQRQDQYGNVFRYRGRALRSENHGDTREVTTYDVFFVPAEPPVSASQGADELTAARFGYCRAPVPVPLRKLARAW